MNFDPFKSFNEKEEQFIQILGAFICLIAGEEDWPDRNATHALLVFASTHSHRSHADTQQCNDLIHRTHVSRAEIWSSASSLEPLLRPCNINSQRKCCEWGRPAIFITTRLFVARLPLSNIQHVTGSLWEESSVFSSEARGNMWDWCYDPDLVEIENFHKE